jgi:CubicO group peptidase (beta-lactamase class C family)
MKTRIALALVLTSSAALAQTGQFTDAAASDPVTLGWMQGNPPPEDRIIRVGDEAFAFPRSRWTYSHFRDLLPTKAVRRGDGPASPLPLALRDDLDAVRFMPIGGTRTMTWRESLSANYTDGIIVLHRGRIVYERYFGALRPNREHIAFSMTKSFIGTIAAAMVAEGSLDERRTVASYLPELARSGFADATLRQLLDMTSGVAFDEDYNGPGSAFQAYRLATRARARPADYAGPMNLYAYLATIPKQGEHGAAFNYRTVNADVLGWIVARVAGKPIEEVLAERIWQPLGAEADGYFQIDSIGTANMGGGFNLRLRDLARFGEMMRRGGRYNGRQIIPARAVADIVRGGSPAQFARAGYAMLPGWSYRDQWWISHNPHGAYAARGIYGQALYIDPAAEMVIARFASPPLPENVAVDPTSLPAYQAVAEHLMAIPR